MTENTVSDHCFLKTSRSVRIFGSSPGIHAYTDVIPESPDGRYVTWFEFDGKPLVSGKVMIADVQGEHEIALKSGTGIAHCGARQGWLDAEHIYFSMNGNIYISDIVGNIVNELPGAIDTISQNTRKGLTYSSMFTRFWGKTPEETACYRVDIDSGNLVTLLDFEKAWEFLGRNMDLQGIPEESMDFKHTKWAPDGQKWFVVFTNEHTLRENPEIPRVKVLLKLNADGSGLSFIGSFGHHPNWLPDSSGIYAFKGDKTVVKWDLDGNQSELVILPGEGHPCISPDNRFITTDYMTDGKAEIYLCDLITRETEKLATMDFPNVPWQKEHPRNNVCHPHPVWSHDCRRLYFNAVERDVPRFCVMEMKDTV